MSLFPGPVKGHSVSDVDIADYVRIPGTLTFATLPKFGVNNAGTQGYTSDQGMCTWNGAAWSVNTSGGSGNSGVSVVPPSGDTTGATDTAAITAAANSFSGASGIVQLTSGLYYINASLPLLAGITYQGVGYQVSSTTTPSLTGGTRIRATAAIAMFSGNATDLGAPYGSAAALFASCLANVCVNSLGLDGNGIGTYGIKCGALYQGGPNYGYFHDVFVQNTTAWNIYIENFSQCSFERLVSYSPAGQGMGFFGSGTGLYNFGNSHFSKLTANGNNSTQAKRGLQIGARLASQLNNVSIFDLGGSSSATTSTQAATFAAPIATTITSSSASIAATNTFVANDAVMFSAAVAPLATNTTYYVSATGLSGTAFQVSTTVGGAVITPTASGTPNVLVAKFGVTDLSQFGVGMPVYFSATANGFTINLIYFVQSVSGATGAGTITVGNYSGAGAIGSTGSTAVNVVTNGWPVVEIGGMDSPSTITYSSVKGASDIENGGTAHVVVQNVSQLDVDLGITHSAISKTDLCVRNVTSSGVRFYNQNNGLNCDFDYTAQHVQMFGVLPNFLSTYYSGAGFTVAGSNGAGQLKLTGAPAIDLFSDPNFFNCAHFGNMVALQHTQQGAGSSIAVTSGNNVTYTGATGTVTLPTLSANLAGWELRISNAGSGTLTVAASGGQNINSPAGVAATTSTQATLTPGLYIAHNNAGVFYWQRYL
jgi:hypothetical protein